MLSFLMSYMLSFLMSKVHVKLSNDLHISKYMLSFLMSLFIALAVSPDCQVAWRSWPVQQQVSCEAGPAH